MRRFSRAISTVLILLFIAVCAGCGQDGLGGLGDTREYVRKILARPAKPIPPLPKVPKYEAYIYSSSALRDPFEQLKSPEELGFGGGNGLHPDMNRKREPLESFPIDSLKMVGTLFRNGTMFAIIKDSNGVVHRVQVGNYMGQNFGFIHSISENQIQLTEIVTDGGNGWRKREASMVLGE